MNEQDRLDVLSRLPESLRPLAAHVPARRVQLALDLVDRRLNGLTVMSEAITRRHNVSAILRSAEAFGLHDAHLITDTFNPSVGAAKGAERWLEITLHARASECFAALRAQGFRCYIADFTEDARSPDDVDVSTPLAVLFGSELMGVSEEARALADGVVMIPMRGLTQSLNVSAAASVILHRLSTRRALVPGAIGVHGEARERFLRRTLEREHDRRVAEQAWWGTNDEGQVEPAEES